MSTDKYILDGRTSILEPDLIKWAEWFEANRGACRVARDEIGEAVVSTIFLGMDHQLGDGPSILFETLVFGGSLDGEGERYST
ncbi:MAG: hypothetical protein ACE5HV_00095 [Acidobacteriota bacterium]